MLRSVVEPEGQQRASGRVASLLGYLVALSSCFGGCYVDREPQQHSDVFGAAPAWTRGAYPQADDRTVGGLQCGGIFCPFTAEPLQPCCTDGDDVSTGRAYYENVCGIDFGGRVASTQGQCWERDQPGLPDDSCPMALPETAVVGEAGCCMASGRCGTRNVADALGCRTNPGVAQDCGKIDKQVECEPTGTFAVRNEVDVFWGGQVGGIAELTDDGRGHIVIDLLLRIEANQSGGLSYAVEANPCQVRLPPFYSSTLCETYDAQFPDTVWDSPEIPPIYTNANYRCLNPGCIVEIEPAVGLIGIDMDNPESLWPTPSETATHSCAAGNGEVCFPDHDLDDKPAITLNIRTDGVAPATGTGQCPAGYNRRAVPLSENATAILDPFTGDNIRRGDRLFLGTRTKLGGTIELPPDCNAAAGVGVAEFVQSRNWGCLLKPGSGVVDGAAGDNDLCQPAEAAFVDENLPIYQILVAGQSPDPMRDVPQHPSEGPITRIVRLGPVDMAVSCEDVRNAAYP